MYERPSLTERSSLAALVVVLLCVPPALAASDGEPLVASICRIIDSSAVAQHLPVAFLSGLIWQESNFHPDAVSTVGARGIAQFMPGTAADRGLANPEDPEAAIPKAAELLSDLKQRFGNLGLAAAAYNAGAARVAGFLAGGGELPPETRAYVMTITRHPVEDWTGIGATKLTDDAVFQDSSCVQHIAGLSRGNPSAFANSNGFSKEAAMLNTYASALNAYLSSLPIQKFYDTYIASQFRLDVFISVALICFLLAYIRGPLNNIRDELRRNKIQLEAILRGGTRESKDAIISKPVPANGSSEFLFAERPPRFLERAEPRTWWKGLAGSGPRGLAASRGLLGTVGQAGVAAQHENGPALAAPAPAEPASSAEGPVVASDSLAQEKPATWPPEVIPLLGARIRKPPPPPEKAKWRGLGPVLLGTGLALFAVCGVFAIYSSPANSAFAAAENQAIAGLAAAGDALKTPLDAITGSSRREEERAATRDLSAQLTQVTVRLDQIAHDYGARLDKLSERMDQESASKFNDMAARLDRLEQKTAAPAAPASQLTDVTARLDKLEKSAGVAAASASQFADIAARLDKLEKRAAAAAAPSSEVVASGTKLDKTANRPASAAASSAKPLLPEIPKPPTLMARAEPFAPNGRAKPDDPRPLLRDYSIEYVQGGNAIVYSRYGSRQVAPGDMIPGAGRVLRIERRGGSWVVLTSLGLIAGGGAAY